MKNESIKNLLFDLGDVIINIDVPIAFQAFAELSGIDLDEIHALVKQHDLFRKFETGQLSEVEFRNTVRTILKQEHWEDQHIDQAWNSLLLDIPVERIELLKALSTKYRLFLLSNTSSIHITQVNKILHQATGITSLDQLFEKVFVSYEMGMMKPDPNIYHGVLSQAEIRADETLFLDDNGDNIAAAAQIGLQTIHVQKPTTILEYLEDYAV
ncbi:putative hydrolase of the HAD superfamily [Dyadobacter jejuensis]|uniref:Putative hydrolase of the HAD superfamily n=1 Tax=Dyadobacter jejuensis TaxID=1082580 RepID=A0A316B824_9BACT|nr:HAD family phosphatase [Dyadobacter jejuensis]PWJ58747.1 putative hydrolase of the HAD superfamily [Dyadobacter jejuensis]